MKSFEKAATKVVDMIENLARIAEEDENIKEYLIKSYDYLDGDDATHAVLMYIEDHHFG